MCTLLHTPSRELRQVTQFDEASNSWHPTEFPVKSVDDIRAMTEMFEDVTVELDTKGLEKAKRQSGEIGRDAISINCIGESPLMQWVEWLAGVENAHFLLVDCQEEVETLFEAMHRVLLKKTRLLCEHSPADAFYLVENTSTTLISPDQYRRYCSRQVGEYAAVTDASGRNLILHMCKPETIRQVCEWVKQYPARMDD